MIYDNVKDALRFIAKASGLSAKTQQVQPRQQQTTLQGQSQLLQAEQYRNAAEQGDAVAQFNLGKCYKYGFGVARDEKQKVEWYRKAAEQGQANAINFLEEIR